MRRATAKTLAPFASLALIAGLAACQPSSADAKDSAGTVASAEPSAKPSAKLDDPTIVAIFDAANTYDVETGLLAGKEGSSPAIREFGKMLARDHQNVRAQGRELAKSLNVTPTPPKDFALATAHGAAMKSLEKLHGPAFDRAFLQHEVDFHNAVIDAVTKTLLPAIQNAQVKDLVTKVAPAFVAHRDAAQNLLNQQK
jgi:putative membrane protein